jgi:hypothetical protein
LYEKGVVFLPKIWPKNPKIETQNLRQKLDLLDDLEIRVVFIL